MKYKYKEFLFDPASRRIINEITEFKPSKELFKKITLTHWGKPVYDLSYLYAIKDGVEAKLDEEKMEFSMALNKANKPIYHPFQAEEIINGFINGLSKDQIEIFSQLDNNNVPLFDSIEMGRLSCFIEYANDKQIKQLKECISEGIGYYQFETFMFTDVSAENMRIYKTLYLLDCGRNFIQNLVKNELNYSELKEVKYLVQCADELLDENSKYKDMNIVTGPDSIVDILREALTREVGEKYNLKFEIRDIIEKCLINKISSVEIESVINAELSQADMLSALNMVLEDNGVYDLNITINPYNNNMQTYIATDRSSDEPEL